MSVFPIVGIPGIKTVRRASARLVFQGHGQFASLPGGVYIQGSQSRDPGNTGDLDVLRAGTLLGKITASTFGTVGMFAPAVTGVTTGAYTSGGTELTVSAAQAVELDRIVGQSGTSELVCIGPPTAAGTVAITAFDHSAIDTTTGVITVTSLGVNKVAGSFVAVNDGRYNPVTFVADGYGVKVTDVDAASTTVQLYEVPIGGVVIGSQLLPWPADASLKTWVREKLSTLAGGKFTFTDVYTA